MPCHGRKKTAIAADVRLSVKSPRRGRRGGVASLAPNTELGRRGVQIGCRPTYLARDVAARPALCVQPD